MRKYKRVNEDILPDEVYNKAWENAKRTYVVTARGAAPYHYEINTEYGIYAKVPNDMGFLAHWFLDTRSRDTVEEMEELASKYIRKYNCKKVSVQEYKKLIDGGVNESYKRNRINEGLTDKERARFVKELTDGLVKMGYDRKTANDIAIRRADALGDDWRARWDNDISAQVRQELRFTKSPIKESRKVKHIKDLTDRQICKLRDEIVLGSLYVRDYENSFGIDAHEVCDFFDGFLDWAEEEYEYRFGKTPKDIGDVYDEFDNCDDIVEYANMIEW